MKELALTTTQNVVIEYPAAKVLERIVAGILDVLIIFILSSFFIYILSSLFDAFEADAVVGYFVAMLPVLIIILYHTLSEVLANGQSLGKKALGIRVVRLDGQKAGFREALLRSLVLFLDLVFSAGVLGILMIATSRRRQRLGDMAANTVVIKSNPPKPFSLENIVKIKSLDDYEPQFPNVIQFTEADILQVKETLSRYQKYRNDAHRKAFSEMIKRLMILLEIKKWPDQPVRFVKTIIQDYIVLTR